MMKKSKKGVTLVELIICCFIIVILGGACTSLLMSGEHIYSTSANAAGAQLDSDVLQTYMIKLLPSTKVFNTITVDNAKTLTEGNCLYFDEDEFTIRVGGDTTVINSISDFQYMVVRAGDDESATARAQFVYKVTMNDDSEFVGGFVLSNLNYAELWDELKADLESKIVDGYVNLNEVPFYFSNVAPES